jgi:26S proteasome regulatory subunit N10
MKKNNISIDIIAFGDTSSETIGKLEAFIENVDSSAHESHLATIPPSSNLLSDSIITTPILSGDGQASGMAPPGESTSGAGNTGDFEFGVDPSMDPELALALRMSLEEEKARQERERKEKDDADKTKLESVPEEGEPSERQPLLDQSGEASGSGSTGAKKDEKKDDSDKMDTA